jgi:hypothetical protein
MTEHRNNDLTEAQLCKAIKAHIWKGDTARDKAEQHYIAAGQHLKALKEQHQGSWAEWEALLKDKVGIAKSRASELMQIADGRKTVEAVREETNQRKIEHRDSSPFRNGEDESDQDDGARNFLDMARASVDNAKWWHRAEIENNAELAATARKVADAWSLAADALGDEEPDEDDEPYNEGTIAKLVERQKRLRRHAKKQEALLEKHRGPHGPEFAALAARLVELDRNVARNVLRSIAAFGPCGYVEGPNFLDGITFAQAIQRALGNEPQFAVEEQSAEADDGLDIPESLRRSAS